jgi:hypothetical protein
LHFLRRIPAFELQDVIRLLKDACLGKYYPEIIDERAMKIDRRASVSGSNRVVGTDT